MGYSLSSAIAVTPAGTTAATLAITPPPAYAAGDLLVMAATGGAATAVNPATPAGWTARSAGGAVLGVFTKTATGAEPASYTVTFSGACCGAAMITAYPAATVVSYTAIASATDVVSASPAFPGGVTSGETVALIAAALTNTGDVNNGSSSENLNLPPSWVTEVAPFGPVMLSGLGSNAVPALGLCDVLGTAATPVLTSSIGSDFHSGYLVLSIPAAADTLQVTATAGGGAELGMVLTVTVLTGAASAGDITTGWA